MPTSAEATDGGVVVTPLRRATFGEAILEQLSELIRDGRIKPGERLPPERELAQQFGVARGAVREALRALALVGLVDIRRGHGVVVLDPSAQPPSHSLAGAVAREVNDIRDVYHARRVIEGEQIRLAASHATDDHIQTLTDLMVAMTKIERERPGDVDAFAALHYQFDLVVAEAAGNAVLEDVFKSIRQIEVSTHLKLLRLPEAMRNSVIQHTAILAAIRQRDVTAAEKASASHFESIEPILRTTDLAG